MSLSSPLIHQLKAEADVGASLIMARSFLAEPHYIGKASPPPPNQANNLFLITGVWLPHAVIGTTYRRMQALSPY